MDIKEPIQNNLIEKLTVPPTSIPNQYRGIKIFYIIEIVITIFLFSFYLIYTHNSGKYIIGAILYCILNIIFLCIIATKVNVTPPENKNPSYISIFILILFALLALFTIVLIAGSIYIKRYTHIDLFIIVMVALQNIVIFAFLITPPEKKSEKVIVPIIYTILSIIIIVLISFIILFVIPHRAANGVVIPVAANDGETSVAANGGKTSVAANGGKRSVAKSFANLLADYNGKKNQ